MSDADNIPEGYEYCTCHPETCCHVDGLIYIGNKNKLTQMNHEKFKR